MKSALLLIESSAEFPSVAVGSLEDSNIVWESTHKVFQSHSEQLPLLVEQAILAAEESGYELVGIAVNEGPGSYTGLRIGSSLAKSLAFAWNVPLMGVSGLLALASTATVALNEKWTQGTVVWALMDARRSEVYALSLEFPDQQSDVRPYVLDEEPLPKLGLRAWSVGNGSFKVSNALPQLELELKASVLFGQALEQFEKQRFADVAYFEPNYVKGFQPGINKKYRV